MKGRARERYATYEEARGRVERAALDELARRDRDLLQRLLQAFAKAYRAAKDNDSALDFEDLQLYARDLLVGNAEIRDRERWRLRSIMVDEFQDTNRLQCELVDLLAGEELFFVGDEFQSIYRFRHADVEVFRERREQTGGVLALTENYRSRPEVLEVINHLFSADFGTSFQPLSAAGRFPDPAFGPAVELLVTDKSTYSDTGVHWRKAEAQHVARRLREIVDAGEATPGEIVLLFAAGTDARLYEEELRALDLPTFRATGRDYYSRQQVVDLLAYLRLLQNRYDDEALVTVLASPFVGVSNDALVLLRRAAGRRPLYAGIERGLPEDMDERDLRLFRAFRQRYERLADGASAPFARAPVRAGRHRARLRPRSARAGGRPAPLREHAQARPPRALVRGAARPRHRGLRPLRPRARLRRGHRARGGRRGGGHGRDPPPHDPRGQGARVQGRRGRRRRARLARLARRGALPAGRPPRLQGRAPVHRQAPADDRLRRGQGG